MGRRIAPKKRVLGATRSTAISATISAPMIVTGVKGLTRIPSHVRAVERWGISCFIASITAVITSGREFEGVLT